MNSVTLTGGLRQTLQMNIFSPNRIESKPAALPFHPLIQSDSAHSIRMWQHTYSSIPLDDKTKKDSPLPKHCNKVEQNIVLTEGDDVKKKYAKILRSISLN